MVTDSHAPMSQSRSPLAMPLPAETPAPGMRARPGSHREDDDAAEVAWGGAQEHDSGMPVVLEDVPDHAGRMPMAVAIAAAAEASDGRPATIPPTFPHGSSDDAIPASARRKRSSLQSAVTAAPDTERNPLIEESSFGAGMLERGAAESHTAKKLILGAVVIAAAAAALLFAF